MLFMMVPKLLVKCHMQLLFLYSRVIVLNQILFRGSPLLLHQLWWTQCAYCNLGRLRDTASTARYRVHGKIPGYRLKVKFAVEGIEKKIPNGLLCCLIDQSLCPREEIWWIMTLDTIRQKNFWYALPSHVAKCHSCIVQCQSTDNSCWVSSLSYSAILIAVIGHSVVLWWSRA